MWCSSHVHTERTHSRMFKCKLQALVRLLSCTSWYKCPLCIYTVSVFFTWCCSYVVELSLCHHMKRDLKSCSYKKYMYFNHLHNQIKAFTVKSEILLSQFVHVYVTGKSLFILHRYISWSGPHCSGISVTYGKISMTSHKSKCVLSHIRTFWSLLLLSFWQHRNNTKENHNFTGPFQV